VKWGHFNQLKADNPGDQSLCSATSFFARARRRSLLALITALAWRLRARSLWIGVNAERLFIFCATLFFAGFLLAHLLLACLLTTCFFRHVITPLSVSS
jgi:hypothetical protein